MHTKILIQIASILTLIGAPFLTYADYDVFSLNPIPPGQPIANPFAYQMLGGGNGDKWEFLYVADSKVTQFDRITAPFCASAAISGTIDLEVRTTSTSSPIVASSSLAVGGNVWVPCSLTLINTTTTTWVLNNTVQWEPGSNIWFTFYNRGGSAGKWSFKMDGTDGPGYFNGNPLPTYSGGHTYNWAAIGFALGIPPITYNASSSNVSCDTFDVGCWISQAGNYLFSPDPLVVDRFLSLNLASSSPFGYIYDMDDALQTFMTGLNATSSSFKVVLDLSTLKNTWSGFNGVSTTSVTVLDVCWVNRPLGEIPANTFRDKFMPIIIYMMWIGIGWLFYSTAHKIW